LKPRTAVGLVVLGALAAVYLLGQGGRTPDASPAAAAPETDMGYVALDAEIRQTGDDGLPLYRVEAQRIVQQPASGAVTAEKLTMRYVPRDADGTPAQAGGWVLTANSAQLPGGESRIQLDGDVVATGRPLGTRRELRIRTESLAYDTATTEVRTTQPVTFESGPQVLTGQGLSANLAAGTLQIDSRVHARIVQ
jgi:LPS export ABC transporter protein LptC